MNRYRIEFFESRESAEPTGPESGRNAPDDGMGRWRGQYRESIARAEALFDSWTTKTPASAYKRVRIRDTTTGEIIRDTLESPVTVVV